MRDVTYRLTTHLHKVDEWASHYEAMAAKGWLLEKKGGNFDRYRRGEPKALQYRIEFAMKARPSGYEPLPEEYMQQYVDCGWTLSAQGTGCYIFFAPPGSDIPKIDGSGTRLSARLTSEKKMEWWNIGGHLLLIGVLFLLVWQTAIGMKLLAQADLMILTVLLLLPFVFWNDVHRIIIINRMLRQLKQEGAIAQEAAPKKRHPVYRTVTAVLGGLIAMSLLGWGVEALLSSKTELPATADGLPYLLGEEVFGASRDNEGVFASMGYEYNYVKSTPTLIAPVQYHTQEDFILDDGSSVSLNQDVYTTWNPWLARTLAWVQSGSSPLSYRRNFTQVEVEGFDLVLEAGWELIAVKGNSVVHCTYISDDPKDQSEQFLKAYAQKLE